MKAKFIFSGLVGLALILGSCGTSNSVVNNGLIQKRKYNKGFFLKSNGQFKTAKADAKEERTFAVSEVNTQENEVIRAEVPVTVAPKTIASLQTPVELKAQETVQAGVSTPVSKVSKASSVSKVDIAEKTDSRRDVRKDVREQVKNLRKLESNSSGADGMTILLVILAIIIPPLAVGLFEGITTRFWIDLILALLGWGLLYWLIGPHLAWLGGLAAIIYALLIVLSVI